MPEVAARLELVRPAYVLAGPLAAVRELVTFDGTQVDTATAADWLGADEQPTPLPSAAAEAWAPWTAGWPTWSGLGTDRSSGVAGRGQRSARWGVNGQDQWVPPVRLERTLRGF